MEEVTSLHKFRGHAPNLSMFSRDDLIEPRVPAFYDLRLKVDRQTPGSMFLLHFSSIFLHFSAISPIFLPG